MQKPKTNNLIQPGKFWAMLGPSFLFVALSLNGGEMMLWPNLVVNYSLTLLWLVPIIVTLQWATDIEIARATAYDGRSVLSELSRNQFLKYFLLTTLVFTLAWPAWVSIAGSTIGFLLRVEKQWYSVISIVLMIALLPAWYSRKYYYALETAAKYGLVVVLVSVVMVMGYFIFNGGLQLNFSNQWIVKQQDFALLYAAVAYGGVAGILNFAHSDWIKSKGYAGSNANIDYTKSSNRRRLVSWMQFIKKEHFVLFWMGNVVGILMIALVATQVLRGTTVTGFQLITELLTALSTINPMLKWLWGAGVVTLFMMAQLTIIDACGRLWVTIRTSKHEDKPALSRNFLYTGIAILVLSSVVPWFRQPEFLLQLSAGMASFSFSFLPFMVLWYNRTQLPQWTQAGKLQQGLVIACGVFYLIMTVLFVRNLFY